MDIKDVFITVNQALTDLVEDIQPDQLTIAIPEHSRYYDGQTLRDSLNVMAYENLCVPKVLAGESGLANNAELKDDLLGENFVANYLKLSAIANTSVREHQDMDRTVHISYGDFNAGSYLTDISLNRCIALYDFAALTGLNATLPGNTIQALYVIATQYADALRQMNIFLPEIKVSDDASAEDELLAFIGRQPKDPSVVIK